MAREPDHFVNSTFSELEDANRNPIEGYHNSPILTLEEAIEKITPPISRVMDYVVTAKKKCNRKSTLLTWDESAAIYLYSMPISFFSCLNEALRAENRHALKPWFAFLKLFTTALDKLPSIKKTVWRGVSGNVSSIFADGDVHIWWSINSFSMDLKVVERYLGETGTVFAIDTIHGKDISAFSTFPDEQEVILMPGTRVRARSQSLNLIDRFFLVSLEEEEDSKSESRPEPNYLFKMVRQKYQEDTFIERIMNPAKTIPIEQSYINLAIVESKEQQEKEKKLGKVQLNEAILSTFEEIYGVKSPIHVKQIFENCKNHRKQVLIFGRAGIGKTTFCRYVTYQWATGAIWRQYELVVFIRLRSLMEGRYPPLAPGANYSPLDLVKKEYFQHGLSEQAERLLKEQLEKSEVLWLLDGYDEIVQNVPPHLQYLFEQLLKTPHHILTSRPYLNTLSYNVQYEITGFTDDNIKEYVEQFFDQIKDEVDNALFEAQKLVNFLKCNPRIWGIAHIPVNLELICSLWCDIDWSETTTLTMTVVYDKMAEWLCRRHLEKQNISLNQMAKDAVYMHCCNELAFLESLAFNGMESNCIILRPELLRIAFKESGDPLQARSNLLNIGVLKSLDYKPVGTRIEADKNHYFVHLSFQEYFAARYLIKALNGAADQKKKAIDFIKDHKYNQHFELVFTFAAGCLVGNDMQQCINTFWDTILGEPLDLIGVRHVQLLIACIEETACNRSLPKFHESIKSIIQWIEYFISTEYDYRYIHIKAPLRRSALLVNQPEILKTFVMLHQKGKSRVKKNVYFLISTLPILNSLLDLTPLHLEALSDPDDRVKNIACEAVGEMGEKVVTNEVIDRLVIALSSHTNTLRENASKALVKLSENSARNLVINKVLIELGGSSYSDRGSVNDTLVNIVADATTHVLNNRFLSALHDTNDLVRCGACRALAKMGEKAINTEVINRLVAAVVDENAKVRQAACYALGKMSKKAAIADVINSLVTALQDVNQDVRYNACEALGKIGEKAATAEVIKSLILAVSDESDKVRESACYTLGEIDDKAAGTDVIYTLMNALRDVNQRIRCSACEALGKLSEKAGSTEAINSLVTALQDVEIDVKCSACKALARIGEKAASVEVINSLVSALQDKNQDVRGNACEALGKIGEKTGTMETINGVTTAAVSKDYNFVSRSCDVFTKVGAKVATHEVIIGLVNALGDAYNGVRSRAYDALEKICTKEAVESVISNLIAKFAEVNSEVRSNAYDALLKIGKNIAKTAVINNLVIALEHKNHYVRVDACRALGQMGKEAINTEVINKLVIAVVDENVNVRQSACYTLGEVGEKVASVEVIKSLVNALQDKDKDVRGNACEALGKIGGKAATAEVIKSLIIAVGDENDKVRQSACYALGEIGEKAASIDVIDSLTSAVRDRYPYVRAHACTALGNIGKKAATNEVVNSLMSAVFDEDPVVKSVACDALGKIGEKAATNKVITSLMTALEDMNHRVRWNACEALEKMIEKAETIELINTLVRVAENKNSGVKLTACFVLSKVCERGETDAMIDCLLNALGEESIIVPAYAYKALRVVCKKGINNAVSNRLATTLRSENYEVKLNACRLLEILGKKAATDEAIGGLLNACRLLEIFNEEAATDEAIGGLWDAFDNCSKVQEAAVSAIENIFPWCSSMSYLKYDTVLTLSSCVNRFNFEFLREIPPDRFLRGFFDTGIPFWLPVIKTVSLRQGYGITVTENTVVLYSSKEPLKLHVSNREICEQLKDGLVNCRISASEMNSVEVSEDLNRTDQKPRSTQKVRKRIRLCCAS